jgi:hypothetical protein
MSTDDKPSAGLSSSGWECKPYGPGTETLIVVVFLGGLICGLLPLFLMFGDTQGWLYKPEVLGVLAMLLLLLTATVATVLRRGRDCLYMDEERIIWYRHTRREYEKMWEARMADLETVIFTGGSFLKGPLAAEIRGRGFTVRCRDGLWWLWSWERTVNRLNVGLAVLRLHPRLLERLIELAESRCESASCRRPIERAREFAAKAAKDVPPAIPVEDAGKMSAALDALTEKVRRGRGIIHMLAFDGYSAVFAVFGVALFFHLRGSFLDAVMPAVALSLIGSWVWVLPETPLFKNRGVRFATHILLGLVLVLVATFIWFFPILWVAMAAYLAFLLYRIADVRFGRRTARRVGGSVAALAVAYAVAGTIYFTNWQTGRVERVFRLRWQGANTAMLALSPDGKMLAFNLWAELPEPLVEGATWVALDDSPDVFARRALDFLDGHATVLFPMSNASLIAFVPTAPGRSRVLAVPVFGAFAGCWSPDSQWLAFDGWAEEGRNQIWLANPWRVSQRMVYETSRSLVLPLDAWTTSGATLRARSWGEGGTSPSKVTINIETGRTWSEPVVYAADKSSSAPQDRRSSLPLSAAVSPNREWYAVPAVSPEEGRVVILRKQDRKEIVSVADEEAEWDPRLQWSPDSRRLAISREHRTLVYDLDTSRVTLVKTWRRGWNLPDVVWSPDSRSLYYARHVALGFLIGLEIVRVTLRE